MQQQNESDEGDEEEVQVYSSSGGRMDVEEREGEEGGSDYMDASPSPPRKRVRLLSLCSYSCLTQMFFHHQYKFEEL